MEKFLGHLPIKHNILLLGEVKVLGINGKPKNPKTFTRTLGSRGVHVTGRPRGPIYCIIYGIYQNLHFEVKAINEQNSSSRKPEYGPGRPGSSNSKTR